MAYSANSRELLCCCVLVFSLIIAGHHSRAGSGLEFLGEQPFRAYASRSTHLGKVLYQLFAVDSETGSSAGITYRVVSSNSSTSRFCMNQGTGEISLCRAYFPSLDAYSITVEANSSLSGVIQHVNVAIIVITELQATARFEHSVYALQLLEGTPVNRNFSVINAFSLAITNLEYSETYSIAGGTSGNVFGIDRTNGLLSVRQQLDRENQDEYFLIVEFSYGSRSIFAQVHIQVLDKNDNVPEFDRVIYNVSVSEDIPVSSTILTVSATDPDLGSGGMVRYTLSPSDGEQFSLNSTTGDLILSRSLDYETVPVYQFSIIAEDRGRPPLNSTVVVIINVVNVNDECPVFQNSIFLSYHAAGSTNQLLRVVATDPDGLSEVMYAIVSASGDDSNLLSIDESTGVISRQGGGSAMGQYFLNVSASDANCAMMSFVPVQIRLDGMENSRPHFQSDCVANLTENPPVNTEVVTLRAVDEDEGFYGRITYSLSDNTIFNIDQSTGVVRTVQQPESYDRERTPVLQVGVVARDGGLKQDYCLLTVTLVDENDHTPSFATPSYMAYLSNSALVGLLVANVSAFDNDAGSNGDVTYSLSTSSSPFVIDSTTGVITTDGSLAASSYTLMVVAADSGTPSLSTNASVFITVSVGSFPVFQRSYYSATVCETLFSTDMILTVEATNSPIYQIRSGLSYESNNGNIFRLNNNNIVMGSSEVINFERLGSRKSFIFSVVAINSQGSNMATVEIFVRDLDDSSPQSGIQSFSVAENQPSGTVVGRVIATDLDSGTYGDVAFVLNIPSQYFAVSTNGTITSARVFDYEGTGQTSGILQVRAYNPNHMAFPNLTECTYMSSDNSVIIPVLWTVLDQDDEPPRFTMESYTYDVSEGLEVGATTLTFNASDPDMVNSNNLYFSIVSGNDRGVFSVDGAKLILRSRLDAERQNSYTLVVDVTDGVHYGFTCPHCRATIHIQVAGIDDTPPIFESSSYSAELVENAAEGTMVLSVAAVDPDSAVVNYFLSMNVQDLFNISEAGDIIVVSGSLDRESFPDGVVSFLVFAVGGGLSSAAVNVTLLDVNDYAPRFESVYISIVEENQTPEPGGTFVARVHASDLDSGRNGMVMYRLESGMEYGFEIDSTSGIITTNAMYDREDRCLYNLRVLAVDQGSPATTSTTVVMVEIGDVNDNAPFFPFPYMLVRVFESSLSGMHVFDVVATDLDNGSNASISYMLVNTSSNLFSLNEATGEITTTGSLDYELPFHRENFLIVSIRDREFLTEMTGNITIIVLDRNDNAPRLTSSDLYSSNLGVGHSINENIPPGPVWATVRATDDDQGTNGELVYSLYGGNGDFEVNDRGEIRTTRLLDFESIQSYNITVVVSDRGVPPNSLEVELTFRVGDVNDNAPAFGESVYKVSIRENSPAIQSVLKVQATDPDSGASGMIGSYRIVSGNLGDIFSLNSSTGVLSTNGPLDREAQDSYTLIISANDTGSNSQTGTAEVKVTVTDVDDNPTLGGGIMNVFLVGRDGMLPVTAIAPIYFNDKDISNVFTDCLRTFDTTGTTGAFIVERDNCTLRLGIPHPPSGENSLIVGIFNVGQQVETTIKINTFYVSSMELTDLNLVTVTVNASAADFFILQLNLSLPNLMAQQLQVSRAALVVVSVEPGYHDPENNLDVTFFVRSPSGGFLSPLDIVNRLYLARDQLFVNGRGIVSIPTDPCLAEPCSNQAKCVVTRTVGDPRLSISSRQTVFFSPRVSLGYRCDCVPGTAGTHCEVNYDDCYSNPCKYGVQCTDGVQGFICNCPEGTFGQDCSFNPNECLSNPCHNGATCVNGFNRYICMCQPGYYGDACQYSYFEISPTCSSNPCQNGGTCSPGRESFACLCPEGYDGPFCEDEVKIQSGCVGNPCYNGSSCTDVMTGRQCTCSVGFTGPDCRWPLNNCELGFCENGATCEQGYYGSYRCSCLPGYTGTNCSVKITACEHNPCENGGRCQDNSDGDSFSCECPPPYTGSRCEMDLVPMDYCATSSCSSGNCTSGSLDYTCTCSNGFHGQDCTVQGGSVTPCSSNPCQYGGTCSADAQTECEYMCACSHGFTGEDCETEIDECGASNPCLNDGKCVDGIGGYFCDCDPGIAGYLCQVHCPAGREGHFCEDVVTFCNSSSCLNGGTCVEATYGFRCMCPVTHTGTRCELNNTCQMSTCSNGGSCVDLEGGGSECSCPSGFRGQTCELLSASFAGGTSVHSYRAFPPLQHQGQGRISLQFATSQANGLLLFSTQYQEGRSLDFIVAEVVGGVVKVALSYGNGSMGVALTSDRVNDGRWHQLSIERSGKSFSVLLDQCHVLEDGILSLSLCQSSASTPGSASFLNLGLPLWVGGVPFSSPDHFSSVGFSGCIRNFTIDDQLLDLESFVEQENSDVGCGQVDSGCGLGEEGIVTDVCGGGTCIPLISGFSCICPAQKTGQNCEKSTEKFMFTGQSYIQYRLMEGSTITTTTTVARRKRQTAAIDMRSTLVDHFSFWFRTERDNGTLFQIGRPSNNSADFVYVELATGGAVLYHVNLGSGEEVLRLPPLSIELDVDDAQWHFFESSRVALNLTVVLDDITVFRSLGGDQLYLDVSPSDVYVGGTPFGGEATFYVGCMEDLRIDHQALPLSGSNEIATVIYSGTNGGQAGGISTGCALRGCFSGPCGRGVCTELGDSDYQCSCDDGSVVRSAACPKSAPTTRFRLLIIILSVVGGLVIALAIFVLIMMCWKRHEQKHRKHVLRINSRPTDNVVLSNRDYVDGGSSGGEDEGGEEDTAMTGEIWKRQMTKREMKNGDDQSDLSSDSTIDKPVLDEEEGVIVANTHMLARYNGRTGVDYTDSLPLPNGDFSPHQRARSPVISAFIDERLESLKQLYRDLDNLTKYVDEGTASPAVSLKSQCSYRPEDEAYTVENLRNAGPEFAKFQVVLETLELEEENVAMDLESERVHTGQTQTQTQTEIGTQLSQSQNGFYF